MWFLLLRRSSGIALLVLVAVLGCSRSSEHVAGNEATVSSPGNISGDRAPGPLLQTLHIPFIENRGQVHQDVAYYARTFAGTLFVTDDGELVLTVPAAEGEGHGQTVIREELVDGARAVPRGLGRSATKVSTIIGDDPAKWRRGTPTYETVQLGQVYEGIELRLRAFGNSVEKVFTAQPGADPSVIRVRARGVTGLAVTDDGKLSMQTPHGAVSYSAPVAYQKREAGFDYVRVAYAVKDDTYGFELGPYDKSRPLSIDPILSATYLGGSMDDTGWSLAIDSSSDVYITGRTFSTDLPGVDENSAQTSKLGTQDILVAKFNSALNVLTHATYIGGSTYEEPGTGDGGGPSIAVHPVTGNIYVTGWTSSSDFPAVANGWQNSKAGAMDAYVTVLESSLNGIIRSTYFGGASDDIATALAIDPQTGDVCITGRTRSTDLPGVSGGAQASHSGDTWDGFAACFSSDLTPLRQATYLGGAGEDWPFSITVHDKSGETNYGSIYITGNTDSAIFPNALANTSDLGGGMDAFVTYLPADLSQLVWMHRIGGTGQDRGYSVDVHPLTGEVYVSGTTSSTDFPGTDDFAAQPDLGGASDGFISNMNAGLSVQRKATYFGGSNSETIGTLSINPTTGDVYLVGNTISTDIPGTTGGAQVDNAGDMDVYIARHSADLSTLLQATYVGGSSRDMGYAVGINPLTDEVYVTGLTWSGNFPTWTGPVPAAQPNHGGGNQDGYVVRLDGTLAATGAPDIDVNPLSVDFGATEVETVVDKDMLIANTGAEDLSVSAISLSDDLNFDFDLDVVVGLISPCGDFAAPPDLFRLSAGEECSLVLTFQPSELGLHKADLLIRSDDPDEGELIVALEGTGGSVPDISVTPSAHSFGVLVVGDSSSQIVTISNIGAAALRIEDIYHLSGSRDFSWKASDCPASLPFLLAKGESCEMLINFAPTDYGERNASFAIDSNDPDESTVVMEVAGGRDTQYLLVEPTEIDLGKQYEGNVATAPISVTNLGLYVLEIRDVDLKDLYFIDEDENKTPLASRSYDPFSLLFAPEAETACNRPPFFLAKGQTCSFYVHALSIGGGDEYGFSYTGYVVMTSNDPDHFEVAVPFEMENPAGTKSGGGCDLSSRDDGPGGSLSIAILSSMIALLVWKRRAAG